MDHLLTITFATPDAASAALGRVARDPAVADLEDACVVSRDPDGNIQVATAADSFWQRLVGTLIPEDGVPEREATLDLPAEFVDGFTTALQPGRSAVLALTNGIDVEPLLATMGRHERLIQCDLGNGGGEALRQSLEAGATERPIWPQAGFGSFQ